MMTLKVDHLGQELSVEIFKLKHGFRADTHVRLGGRHWFARARGPQVSSAIAALKVEITRWRDAQAIKEIRRRAGLTVVAGI